MVRGGEGVDLMGFYLLVGWGDLDLDLDLWLWIFYSM